MMGTPRAVELILQFDCGDADWEIQAYIKKSSRSSYINLPSLLGVTMANVAAKGATESVEPSRTSWNGATKQGASERRAF